MYKREAKESAKRCSKAEWAINLCTSRRARDWPLEVAIEIGRIGIRCSCRHGEDDVYTRMTMVMKDMEEVRKMADDRVADNGCVDVTKDPHIASDGFSYELSAIKQWLDMGNNTSPMTNLELEHQWLTPNHTLCSLIQDWHKKRSIPIPLT
ncbi:putative U box domain, Zinc finger, RING/FYVE/PHD-type [Helianthus anomalus]